MVFRNQDQGTKCFWTFSVETLREITFIIFGSHCVFQFKFNITKKLSGRKLILWVFFFLVSFFYICISFPLEKTSWWLILSTYLFSFLQCFLKIRISLLANPLINLRYAFRPFFFALRLIHPTKMGQRTISKNYLR